MPHRLTPPFPDSPSDTPIGFQELCDRLTESLQSAAPRLDLVQAIRPQGLVQKVGDGVAHATGLNGIGFEELVQFDSGALGMAFDLRREATGIVLLTNSVQVSAGEGVRGLGTLPALPVGPETLGRIFDPLGRPLDEDGPVEAASSPLFRPAPELIDRCPIDTALQTGVLVLDAAIPIGRGQRELIIGDRNVGKTALALDIVAAQKAGDVACVYVVIGQPISRVLALRQALEQADCLSNTAFVAADSSMSPGMQYLAPYAGATVAEWFRDQGRDALIIYDDLSKHADAYRELALLLNRPPGREAFPGDIFYIHAELLERAAARRPEAGGGSVTALPIVETTESDISAYIPTNLISITDGQIYLDTTRFERNQRPAVDVGKSVSRIGSAAQTAAMKQAARNLRILISRFEALEALTRVGLDVDAATQQTVRRGKVLRELLKQARFQDRDVAEQVLTLTLVSEGWLDNVEPGQAQRVVQQTLRRFAESAPDAMQMLQSGQLPRGDWTAVLRSCLPPAGEG